MLNKILSVLLIGTCLFFSLSGPVEAKDKRMVNILLLNSYHKGFDWVDGIVDAVESGLNTQAFNYDLRVEYMDTKAIQYDAAYKKSLYAFYSSKYTNQRFDIIICSDDHAFDFLREYHRSLFPETPIVFCAVNNKNAADVVDPHYFTGVLETPDQESMINLALALHPGIKKIYLIADTTPSGNYRWEKQTVPLISVYPNIAFIRIDDSVSFSQIERQMIDMPEDAISFYAIFTRDKTGQYFPLKEAVSRISTASRRPIYTFLSQDLQYGLIGGKVLSGFQQGKKAVDMAIRILNGARISDIPIETKSTSQFMFNHPQLVKYHINPADLPQESIIIDNPVSFYEKNKRVIRGVSGVFVFLLVLVTLLAVMILKSRKARQELLETEKKLRLLFDNSPVGICTVDPLGNFITTNPAYEQMLGYSKEQLKGMSFFDVTHPDYLPRKNELFQEMFFQDSTGFSFEKISVRRDKTQIRVSVNAKAVIDEKGDAVFGTAFIEDITERKQAETKLVQSKQMMDSVINGIAEPIFVKDENHHWTMFNDAFCRLVGRTRDDLLGKTDFDFLPEHEANVFWEHDNLVLASDTLDVNEEKLTIGGKTRILSTTKSPFKNPITGHRNIVGNIRDITDAKGVEDQLWQAQKMESVGRLAGGVAHDFNNMLSIIIGYSESALENIGPEDLLYEDIGEILAAGRRSAEITRQLLAFARQQTVAPRVLDLNDSIEGMLKMLRRLIGEDIDLVWLPGADLQPVKIDPTQIDQILANLCVNARDAIPGVGRITIETRNICFDPEYCESHLGFIPGEYVMFGVSDNGNGIAPEILEKIFDPFFTTKGLHQGTGLGLSTVYGIAKQNNGFVNVYSEIGIGTTVKCYLQAHAGKKQAPLQVNDAQIPLSTGETILMVEDDKSILKLGQRMLNDLGYHVLPASSPGQAIKCFKENIEKITLLITDVVMPEMNGRELSQRLIQLKPDLKILYMSGYTADVIAHRGVLEEGAGFIPKPLSKNELAVKIRETLENENKRNAVPDPNA